ncbi:hypothetical protein Tco_1059012 [Tanacetum coccineum]
MCMKTLCKLSTQKMEAFFVYGSGGTGKTYLWNTIIASIRSQGKIVLSVASSGIASLLLPGGRTSHSRFRIPIDLDSDSCCGIDVTSDLAELIRQSELIIWDEAPLQHRHAFEAVDRTLRDVCKHNRAGNQVFGGKVIVLGGDFRQILLVIPKARRSEIVSSAVNKSAAIWDQCKVFILYTATKYYGDTVDVVKEKFGMILTSKVDSVNSKITDEDERTMDEIQ